MRLGVRGKIFLLLVGIVVFVVLASGAFLGRALDGQLHATVEREMARVAAGVAVLLEDRLAGPGDAATDSIADELGAALGMRVTIVLTDGRVAGDSELSGDEIGRLENHGDRPEIAAALAGGRGTSWRYSTTMENELIYSAARFRVKGAACVVRVSRPVEEIDDALDGLHGVLLVAGFVGLAMAVVMGLITSHYFTRTLRSLVRYAQGTVEGRRQRMPLESGGELGGLASSVQRIAEGLERRVDELKAERNRFGAVLEGMSEAVIALDENRRVTLINGAGLHLLGLGEQPIGRTILETMRVPELSGLLDELEPGRIARVEFDFGSAVKRRVLATASRRSEGDYVVVFLDVTELRRLETIRRDFVSNVSHELRTPVSIIKANAETLLDGAIDDRDASDRFLRSMMVHAERLSHLVGDLLDISRIEEGKYELELEDVPLGLTLRRAAAALETAAIKRGTSIRVEAVGGLTAVADPKALDQVLFNLVDNAVKYTQDNGRIALRAARDGDRVVLEVEDDGPGVEPRHRDRLFERFFRVDKGRSREMGGTGLGLAIVKHLVTAMNGEVGMRPADGRGSIFWVRLIASDRA